MLRAFFLSLSMTLLAAPVTAGGLEPTNDVKFCLAKDDQLKGSDHRALLNEYGFDCATVYWKLSSEANRKDPYTWVRDQYQNKNIPVVLTLIIDEGESTIGTSEGTDVSSGVPGLLYRVVRGDFDKDLSALAQAIKADGRPVTVRLFHELDGSWYRWGIYATPKVIAKLPDNAGALEREVYKLRVAHNKMTTNSPVLAVGAVAHVVRQFDVEGVKNVEWEVNFNRRDGKGEVLGEAEYLIPQLEAIGVSAYSISTYNRCGSSENYTEQLSFADEFAPIYERLTALTDKPIRVAETSTTDFCAPKGPWFTQMAKDLKTRFPRVDMVTVLFGTVPVNKASNNVLIDWSCGGEKECIAALKKILQPSFFSPTLRPVPRPTQ